MLVQFQMRSDTLAGWTAENPILAKGEPAYEEDTKVFRIGDGVSPYLDLAVQTADTEAFTELTNAAVAAAAAAAEAADRAESAAGSTVPADETTVGVSRFATDAEALAGVENNIAVDPAALAAVLAAFDPGTASVPDASTTVKGIVELATNAETTTGTSTTLATTPAGVAAAVAGVTIAQASETVAGKVELATTAEATAGTDTVRAVTPAGLAAAIATIQAAGLTNYSQVAALAGYPATFPATAHSLEGATHTGNLSADRLTDGSVNRLFTSAEKTKLGNLPSTINAAAITDSGSTGRALIVAANASAARTALGLTDADLLTLFSQWAAANNIRPAVVHYVDEPDPTVAQGTVVYDVDVQSEEKQVEALGEAVTSAAGTSISLNPVSTADDTTVVLTVTGHQQSANAATRGAGLVASVTGGGRTWTQIPNTGAVTTNGQVSIDRWVGIRSGVDPTTTPIVATMAAGGGTAPSSTHDRIVARAVGVTNTLGEVSGVNSGSTSSLTPTLVHTGVEPDAVVLAEWAWNSASQTVDLADTVFTALAPPLSVPSNAVREQAGYVLTPVGTEVTLSLTASANAQKILTSVKVR